MSKNIENQLYEIGYTPSNLKTLLDVNNITQAQAYKIIGKSRAAFERYLKPFDHDEHVSMSYKDWIKLRNGIIDLLEQLAAKAKAEAAKTAKQPTK